MEAEVTQNTPPDWEFFMKQLQRVETLSKRVGFSEIRISEAQDDILAIKQEVGMQEGEKEKNVIQKKVSSILTANQKKRYENIGKQFVQGAGKQFARIKSAIKYNQQMQTNKKKFEEGAVKVKETSKKTVKTGGFWKKILGVIAILGMVGLLFRDKIAKMLPDLSGSMDGIGEKIYSFFSTVISNVVQYSTNVLGGTITGVIQYACTKILPNIITTFFNSTLPVALVAATLTVMSMFSDSAGEQAQSLLQKQAEAPSENIASGAEVQFDALRGMQQLSKKQAFDFNNLEAQTYWGIVGMMTSFSEWLISTDAASKKVFEDLDAAIDVNGAVDLASLENFNMTSLLLQLENAKGKTEEEKRGIIISHLSKAGVNTNGLTISKSLIDNLVSMGGRMVTNENYVKLQQAKEAAMQRESTEMIPSQTQPSVSLMNVRDINISQVISRNFISSCKEVLESLEPIISAHPEYEKYDAGSKALVEDNKVVITGRVQADDEKDGKLICESIVSFEQIPKKLWIKFATKEDFVEKEERLRYLKNVKRLEVLDKLKVARDFGDLSENSEYDAAKKEQSFVETEIAQILSQPPGCNSTAQGPVLRDTASGRP